MTGSNSGRAGPLRRYLPLHIAIYLVTCTILAVLDYSFFETRWFYWPAMVWGVVLGVHILYCKSLSVDESWAEARADKLREKSYDLGHIMKIEEEYKESVEASAPADEPQENIQRR